MKRAVVEDLAALCERVEQWRKRREGPPTRIPEELWEAAVRVARIEGVGPTSRALHFDHSRLKGRVELTAGQERGRRGEKSELATFIELGPNPLATAVGVGGKTVVEIVGRRGGRMRIDVSGSGVEIVGLAQAFWSHES
jgi:hypothetical protein